MFIILPAFDCSTMVYQHVRCIQTLKNIEKNIENILKISTKDKNVFWSLDSCEFDLHHNALENVRFHRKISISIYLNIRKPKKVKLMKVLWKIWQDGATWHLQDENFATIWSRIHCLLILVVPLALITMLATRWSYMHWLQIWPPGGATCISCKLGHHNLQCIGSKFGHEVVPLQ